MKRRRGAHSAALLAVVCAVLAAAAPATAQLRFLAGPRDAADAVASAALARKNGGGGFQAAPYW